MCVMHYEHLSAALTQGPFDGVMNMLSRASSKRLVACAYLSRPVCGMVGIILIRSSLWVARG